MECDHKKIIDVVEDIEKAKKKEVVCKCFICGQMWTKKDWERYLKKNKEI